MSNHCKDCCCAQAWKALGVSEYTGKSIVEHIEELKTEMWRLNKLVSELATKEEIYQAAQFQPVNTIQQADHRLPHWTFRALMRIIDIASAPTQGTSDLRNIETIARYALLKEEIGL